MGALIVIFGSLERAWYGPHSRPASRSPGSRSID